MAKLLKEYDFPFKKRTFELQSLFLAYREKLLMKFITSDPSMLVLRNAVSSQCYKSVACLTMTRQIRTMEDRCSQNISAKKY